MIASGSVIISLVLLTKTRLLSEILSVCAVARSNASCALLSRYGTAMFVNVMSAVNETTGTVWYDGAKVGSADGLNVGRVGP